MQEIWRDVVGFDGLYEVSNIGRVRSKDKLVRCLSPWGRMKVNHYKGKLLKPWPIGKYGHLFVGMYPKNSKGEEDKVTEAVHRLVLEAFVGPCPEGMCCRHFPDRDPSNNKLENLSWGTKK